MEIFEIFNKKIPDSKKTTQDSYERGNCETDTVNVKSLAFH